MALLPFDEEFRGTVGSLRDISARLERNRRLERQRDRLEEFASVVSHDLKSPLNVATGQLSLAREACENDHLDAVANAHDRMAALIEDLLTLAREGRDVTDLEPVEVASVADRAWAAVVAEETALTNEAESTIEADRSRLRQLLENLFRNAVQHGGDSVTVGDLTDGFYVADDGPGIPPDERETVFEVGYTSAAEGTGFGLRIVKEIAEAHGWTIALTESQAGGARFEVRETAG